MHSIINLKWFSRFVVVLLVISLLTPSVSYALDAHDGGDGNSASKEAADREAAEKAAEEAKEKAEAEQAAADAAEVSAAAAAAGISASVSAVSTAGPATPGNVNVNGVSMSKEQAMSAIGSMSAAQNSGMSLGKDINVDKSFACGCTVGARSGARSSDVGTKGVAEAEIAAAKGTMSALEAISLTPAAVRTELASLPNTISSVPANTVTTAASLTATLAQAAKTAGYVANELVGVTSAVAAPTAMEVSVAPKAHVTEDLAAYTAYKNEVAPVDKALAQAWNDVSKAIGTPNEDAAWDKVDALSAQKESLISSTFGVNAKEVQYSGTKNGTAGAPASTGNTQTSQPTTNGTPGNTQSPASSQTAGTPTGGKTGTPDFSYSGKATDAGKTAPTGAGTGNTGAGTGTGQPSAPTKSAQVTSQVQARDNQITREGGGGGGSDSKSLNEPTIAIDLSKVRDLKTVNVNSLSDAQAQVAGIANKNLSAADKKALALALGGELYGPSTTNVAQGKATEDDITAVKTIIFSFLNRSAQSGKTVEQSVKQGSAVFYTNDGVAKDYAQDNYNQNSKAFDKMVDDVLDGVYGIDLPCPNCVDFGANGPSIFDKHVTTAAGGVESGTHTNANRQTATSEQTTEAIQDNAVSKAQGLLTFQNRGLGDIPNPDIANITNPESITDTNPTKVASNETDDSTTGSLPNNNESTNSKAGAVYEMQGGKHRSAHINKATKDQLAYAGKVTGTYFVVGSGGNEMSKAEYNAAKGKKTKIGNVYYLNGKAVRVGSTRHDHGNSADGSIVDAATGRTLDFSNLADRARIADFITASVKAGATGVGAAADYMGTKTVHIGGGATLAWGKAGRAKHAPGWVKEAHANGLEQAKGFDLAKYNAENGHNTQVAGSPEISTETTGTIETTPGVAAALEKAKTAKDKITEHSDSHGDDTTVDDGLTRGIDTNAETNDEDSTINEATEAAALSDLEVLSERISEIETQLNTKDLSDEQVSALTEELETATEAIDLLNKAIEAAESGETEAGLDALTSAQDLLNEVEKMTEANNNEVENVEDRVTTPNITETPDIDVPEVSVEVNIPLPAPVVQALKNPVVRAVVTAAILGTNPVVGIAVAVGLDKVKDIPVIGKILDDLLKNFGNNSGLSLDPTEKEGGGGIHSTSTKAIYTVPVIVTTDARTGIIDLTTTGISYDYESIEGSEEGEELYYPNDNPNSPPLVLNEFGEIVYSDGTYAPIHINGVEYPDPETEYVYFSQVLGEDGPVVIDNNTEVLPENFATKFVKNIFGNTGTFTINDVAQAVRYYVDPKPTVPNDEYYDYVITLKDRTVRTTIIPVYTSYELMQERLKSIGYDGDVIQLLSSVEDGVREVKPSLFNRTLDAVNGVINNFWPEQNQGISTDLSTSSQSTDNVFDINDIKEITVYVGIDAECPAVLGLDKAYIYETVIYQSSIPDAPADGIIQEVRCGTGDPYTYAKEIGLHMQRVHGFTNLSAEKLLPITTFNFYNPPPQELDLSIDPIDSTSTEDTPPEVELLPNITNTISLEVRATNDVTKQVIVDWSTDNLVITPGVSLDFRWDGSDYQQCLPFLNDNGNYALTRNGLTDMTSGNTATEKYDIKEAAYTYIIECGGQRNNEFGVDRKTISVSFE